MILSHNNQYHYRLDLTELLRTLQKSSVEHHTVNMTNKLML